MMRVIEVIIAVGILVVGIAGLNIYLSTQPINLQPQSLTAEAYTVLAKLQAGGPLTCSSSQKERVEDALYVLLPPTIRYNFTVYVLQSGKAQMVYTIANTGQPKTLYQTTVEVLLVSVPSPQPPGSTVDLQPPCFGVLSLGEA